MKKVLYFYLEGCPHCRRATGWMEQLVEQNPQYEAVDVRRVEERDEAGFARGFDYYYVPAFYVDGVKVHEGAATKQIVQSVYERALAD
jgi:glutaredoxin